MFWIWKSEHMIHVVWELAALKLCSPASPGACNLLGSKCRPIMPPSWGEAALESQRPWPPSVTAHVSISWVFSLWPVAGFCPFVRILFQWKNELPLIINPQIQIFCQWSQTPELVTFVSYHQGWPTSTWCCSGLNKGSRRRHSEICFHLHLILLGFFI